MSTVTTYQRAYYLFQCASLKPDSPRVLSTSTHIHQAFHSSQGFYRNWKKGQTKPLNGLALGAGRVFGEHPSEVYMCLGR